MMDIKNKMNIYVKCEYCSYEYRKYSLKQHLLRCKSKIEFDKNQIIKINSSKKFIEIYNKNISLFENLPNEIIKLIVSYLFEGIKDEYSSHRRICNEYLNISYVSKRIYNIIYPSYEQILIFKNNLKEEKDKRICKTTAKSNYKLSESELENLIPYSLYSNPHYRTSSPMKLYQITDILDYMYNKYHSKQNHTNQLLIKEEKKKNLRQKRYIALNNKKINLKE